jgi:hypothetical protein
MDKAFQISNPCFLSDTFIFKEKTFKIDGKKEVSTVYITVNRDGKIEGIRTMLEKRLYRDLSVLMDSSNLKEASKRDAMLLDSIDDEMWYSKYREDKRYYAGLDEIWADINARNKKHE